MNQVQSLHLSFQEHVSDQKSNLWEEKKTIYILSYNVWATINHTARFNNKPIKHAAQMTA
jgi:hypothetical protein